MVGWLGDQVEQQLRQGLKQAVEERVGLHLFSFSTALRRSAVGRIRETTPACPRSGTHSPLFSYPFSRFPLLPFSPFTFNLWKRRVP